MLKSDSFFAYGVTRIRINEHEYSRNRFFIGGFWGWKTLVFDFLWPLAAKKYVILQKNTDRMYVSYTPCVLLIHTVCTKLTHVYF